MKHCKYIGVSALLLIFLGSRTVTAQEATVAVGWKIAPACGASFPIAVLQQDLADQLRAASIAVSRVHTAGLVSDVNCEAIANRKSVSVQQCLSLSQAVSSTSAANGLHLATTWRNCQTYVCAGQNCGLRAQTAQHDLAGQFIPAFRALIVQNKAADPVPPQQASVLEAPSIPAVYAAASRPILKPSAIYYSLYILTCLAVLVRWQLCR